MMKLPKRGSKGFTLMEMLIVVAIVAILVAISIPIFNTQLEKAREATDAANERAAKAVAVATYLTADPAITAETTYYYNAVDGVLAATAADAGDGYGKGTDAGTLPDENTDKHVKVVISTSGAVTTSWE